MNIHCSTSRIISWHFNKGTAEVLKMQLSWQVLNKKETFKVTETVACYEVLNTSRKWEECDYQTAAASTALMLSRVFFPVTHPTVPGIPRTAPSCLACQNFSTTEDGFGPGPGEPWP